MGLRSPTAGIWCINSRIEIKGAKTCEKGPRGPELQSIGRLVLRLHEAAQLVHQTPYPHLPKLPEDYEDKLTKFQIFTIKMRKKHQYSLSQIGNADQTPLTFDLPADTTINAKGASTVSIKTTGKEKKWGRRPGAGKDRSMLVLYAFLCHRSPVVKSVLNADKTDLAIIPGGMTSVLQPLDTSVNKHMKVALQQRWDAWMCGSDHTYTNQGGMRKPELTTICSWIKDAWEELGPEIIIRTFKKCCISNALNESEDDVLWEDGRACAAEESDDDAIEKDIVYEDDSDDDTPLSVLRDIYHIFESDDDEEEFQGF